MKLQTKYPIIWRKNNFGIKIFCSIPNIATGIVVNAKENLIVVDPGDGILRDLNNDYTTDDVLSISDIFITHGHHDHVGGVWSLLTYFRVMRRKMNLNIYYPKGCIEIESIYNAFRKVYSNSISYKIFLKEISDNKTIIRKDIKVKPFKVLHKEILSDNKSKKVVPSLGYNFVYDGMTICYGGDTAYCDSLVKAAKNADLAILEAGSTSDLEDDDMHMSIEVAKSIGKSAKEFYLVHVPE
ncbi:MAG TPA: ribonuclease Z [Ignavibacteriaceae bacterium]|nr:ribonuclease Z [Ignavibacteriaceae bacterium]